MTTTTRSTSDPAHRRPLLRMDGERGSSLVLALAFTTIILSITVAVLAFSRAGTKSVHAFEVERNRRYAVDGALQAAVQMVSLDSTMGVTGGTTPCSLKYLVQEGVALPGVRAVAGGAYVTVDCAATSTTVTGGATSGKLDPQEARDVTFTVKCNNEPVLPGTSTTIPEMVNCRSGTTSQTLAIARVRFEPDFTKTSATDAPKRATIPKIISWQVRQ